MKIKTVIFSLIFLLAAFLSAQNDPCKNLQHFTPDQLKTIAHAYNYGKKHNLGYTMAAIAWKESCAGLYRINFSDPSAGIYHAHLPGVIKRHYKQADTAFRRNVIAEKLIRDSEFASKIALEELLYWRKVRKGNWKEMIKSYNKGFSWEKSKGRNVIAEAYHEDIALKVEQLKTFFKENPELLRTKTQLSPSFRLLRE